MNLENENILENIIKTFYNKKLKQIVNIYQLKYTNGIAQGLGDYIRGCFCLLQISLLLNLQFDMELTNHPISKYIKREDSWIKYDMDYDESKIAKYEDVNYIPINSKIYKKDSINFFTRFINNINLLDKNVLNKSNNKYFIFCNSFPIFDNITNNNRLFIQSKLQPNEIMQQNIKSTLIKLNLVSKQFAVIHIRSGDKYLLKNNKLNTNAVKKIIKILLTNIKMGTKYLVLSDNNQIKLLLTQIFPQFIFQMSNITHLGESINQDDQSIMETLLDFYLMSNSFQIISFSPYNWGSGFSQWCSILYNIPFIKIQVLESIINL